MVVLCWVAWLSCCVELCRVVVCSRCGVLCCVISCCVFFVPLCFVMLYGGVLYCVCNVSCRALLWCVALCCVA